MRDAPVGKIALDYGKTTSPLTDRWAIPVLLFVLTFTAFVLSISFDFVWDDWKTLVQNPRLNPPTWASLGYYWTHAAWNLYMPVTCSVWAALARLGYGYGNHFNPAVFHLANVLLHWAVAIALYGVLRRVVARAPAAVAGSLVFAVHPIQCEVVCFIGAVNNLICGLFSFLALSDYLDAVAPDDAGTPVRRRLLQVRGMLWLMLALLSKPTAVVVPVIAVALDWAAFQRPARSIARSIAPWILLVVPCMVWTKLMQPGLAVAGAVPSAFRPLVAADAVGFYVFKILMPFRFAVDYGRTASRLFTHPGMMLPTISVTAALTALAWIARRRAPILTAAVVAFMVALLPNSGLVPSDFQQFSTVADRYAYLAMFGPSLAIAWFLSRQTVLKRPRLAGVVTGILIVAMVFKTKSVTEIWRNDRTLFANAVHVTPDSAMAHENLAFGLLRTDPAAALTECQTALRLRPGQQGPHRTLTIAYTMLGDRPAALREAQESVRLNPGDASAHRYLGRLLDDAGDRAAASQEYRAALTLDPNDAESMTDLAAVLAEEGQFDEAIRLYEEALLRAPNLDAARRGLSQARAARFRRSTTR